ncbi:MAG: hypothetical protein ABUT39_10880 [Acidobacteriota bacterium]
MPTKSGLRLISWLLLGLIPSGVAAAQDSERAFAVEREVLRIAAERALWPKFDPLSIPLAVFTGERTYLFRHPAPPEGFTAVPDGRALAFVFPGRYPAVTANTSAEVGGTLTATLLADRSDPATTTNDLAAVALHEAFHVYQKRQHPGWAGNEGDLLLYPIDDARLLALRRLESEALRRALSAPDTRATACWTRLAMAHRRERFAAMEPAFSAYERLTELNEGLAAYVQLIAGGRKTVEIPAGEFAPAQVRARVYAIGPALALLLDRLRPGWQESVESGEVKFLDEALESAAGKTGEEPAPCSWTPAEVAGIESAAKNDTASVVQDRASRRKAFDARSGWRVIVEPADGRPLWPQGFDPLNVERVDGGLLHTRFLKLGNDDGDLQAIDEAGADIEAFTEGAGPHPLFNGVRRVVVAGLAKPEIATEGGTVTIRGSGFTATFKNAGVRTDGTTVVVRVAGPAGP